MMKAAAAGRHGFTFALGLAVALIAATESHAAATIALDNTASGLAGSSSGLTTSLWRVRVFTVGASNVSISSMKMGLYSTQTATPTSITWELYLVDGSNNPTGTALASDTQSVSFTSTGGSSSALYNFTTGGTLATFSMQAGQKYGLLFKSNAATQTLNWTPTSANTVYSAGSSGFAYVTNRVTSNSGASYSGNSTYNAWSMTVNPASAVPGTGLAAIAGLGMASMRRRRR